MPNVNTSSITPILKELYEGPIQSQIQDEMILTARIESTNKGVVQKAGGKYVDFPVVVGRNQGISFRAENEDLGEPGRARMKEVSVPLYYGYGRVRIQGQLFEIAETDTQAFINAVDNEMDTLKDSVKKDQNRIYYGDGTGTLATITATATSATQTVNDAYWLEVDAVVDVMNAAGTKIGTALTVTDVDYTANTVVLSGSVAATANTHFIVRAGNYDTATQREPSGLARITNNAVNLHGLNDSRWKAVTVAHNNALSESVMIKMCDDIRRNGGMVSAIFTSFGVRRAYFNLLSQQRRQTDPVTLKGGFSGLPFNYGAKIIPIVEDPDCPEGRMYFVTEKDLRVYHTKDWHFEDKTGSMFVQVPNKDAFDLLMKRYFEMGTRRRNGMGVLTGVTPN